jgi:hypothetical protein
MLQEGVDVPNLQEHHAFDTQQAAKDEAAFKKANSQRSLSRLGRVVSAGRSNEQLEQQSTSTAHRISLKKRLQYSLSHISKLGSGRSSISQKFAGFSKTEQVEGGGLDQGKARYSVINGTLRDLSEFRQGESQPTPSRRQHLDHQSN